jgi:hypothetical protein
VAEPGLNAIRPEALSAHVRFLADDLLEGRNTGSRGHAIAARYFAAQLQSLGYEPAGENGTWFQTVPFVGMTVKPEGCELSLDGQQLKYGEEVVFTPRAGSAGDDVTGELVFAGYGVTAPEYKYDDLPKDLRGKIAVVIYGAPHTERPGFFPIAASAVYSDPLEKARRLARAGAVGMVIVFNPELETHLPFSFMARQTAFESMVWKDGDKPGSGYALPGARMPAAMLQRLIARTGRKADQLFAAGPKGSLKPFPLGIKAHLKTSYAVREFTSENAAGILRSGPENVVITAHLDHLGVGLPINGDAIYNGAVDNATGVSSAIEVARAFAALPKRPPRSILVVGVTGEEKGLQGSEYFTTHPTVPIGSIVADVNIDVVDTWWRPHDVVAQGAEHSTIQRAVDAATGVLGLAQSPDPEPEQVFFIRSDQYNFVKQGIPSVHASSGWRDEAGSVDKNRAKADWWTKNRYHQPSDEWDPKGDYEAMAIETRADFLIALAIALDPERPRWNDGDVFGKIFARR